MFSNYSMENLSRYKREDAEAKAARNRMVKQAMKERKPQAAPQWIQAIVKMIARVKKAPAAKPFQDPLKPKHRLPHTGIVR
jgi:hypothetical protein